MSKTIYTLEIVQNIMLENNCVLNSKEYINNKTKLDISCPCGNHFYVSLGTFLAQNRRTCEKCSRKRYGDTMRMDLNYVKEYLKNIYYESPYLEKEYNKSNSKLTIICNKNHKTKMTWGNINCGNRCKVCAGMGKTIENIRELIKEMYGESIGLKVLNKTYSGMKDKIEVIDNKGYKYSLLFHQIKIIYDKGQFPARIHPKNPHTIHNISIFLKENNLPLKFLAKNIR